MAQAQTQKTAAPGVEQLIQMHWAGMASRGFPQPAVARFLAYLLAGHSTAKEIAQAAGRQLERGIGMLLNALGRI